MPQKGKTQKVTLLRKGLGHRAGGAAPGTGAISGPATVVGPAKSSSLPWGLGPRILSKGLIMHPNELRELRVRTGRCAQTPAAAPHTAAPVCAPIHGCLSSR
jgi:hypothetical protein